MMVTILKFYNNRCFASEWMLDTDFWILDTGYLPHASYFLLPASFFLLIISITSFIFLS